MFFLICSLALCLPPVSHAQPPSVILPFDKFRLVQTRNIFDPDRRAMIRPQDGPEGGVRDSKPVTRADYVALTGIMVTEGKSLAFFSGSRAEYNKVLPVRESIAGATITKITPADITVERDGKTITVAVGQTVPFDDSAPVAAPTPAAPPLDPQVVSAGAPLPATSPSSTAPSSSTSDLMRRMMERRQQELK